MLFSPSSTGATMRDNPSTHELADALVETIIARYELTADRLVKAVGASDLFTYWQPVYWDAQVQHDDERQLAEFEQLIPHLSHLHTNWRAGGRNPGSRSSSTSPATIRPPSRARPTCCAAGSPTPAAAEQPGDRPVAQMETGPLRSIVRSSVPR